MSPKQFTLDEAQKLLPRLTKMLTQMRELRREHDRFLREIAHLEVNVRSNGHDLQADVRNAREGVEKTAAELNSLMERTHALGCEMKGVDEGLVDFRTLMEGREVYLCWRLGEDEIGWWHELDTGFTGRQRLPERSTLE